MFVFGDSTSLPAELCFTKNIRFWNLREMMDKDILFTIQSDIGDSAPILVISSKFQSVEKRDKSIRCAVILGFDRPTDDVLIFCVVKVVWGAGSHIPWWGGRKWPWWWRCQRIDGSLLPTKALN